MSLAARLWVAAQVVLIFCAGVCLLVFKFGLYDTVFRPVALKPAEPAKEPYLTVFLIDGLRSEVFERELELGNLPNWKQMIEQGAYVPYGITAFPSMTGYAFYPFLTGHDSIASGILGLRWFDRSRKSDNFRNYVGATNIAMDTDITNQTRLLYERFSSSNSYSINTYMNRGITYQQMMGLSMTATKYGDTVWWWPRLLSCWLWPNFDRCWTYPKIWPLVPVKSMSSRLLPNWFAFENHVLSEALHDLRNHNPKIQWITLASPDGFDHVYGSNEQYAAVVRHCDQIIGKYRRESARLGVEEKRLYAVISDHGMTDIFRSVDMRVELKKKFGLQGTRGTSTFVWTSKLRLDLESMSQIDFMEIVNGNTMNYLYFRNFEGSNEVERWTTRLRYDQLRQYPLRNSTQQKVDLISTLLNIEGVELVLCRGSQNESVMVNDYLGNSALIQRHENNDNIWLYSYQPLQSGDSDPLGYLSDTSGRVRKLADGQPHSSDEWLSSTYWLKFPYAVPRIANLLLTEAASCGDVVVTARKNYDLAPHFELFVGHYRGGHGGLRADQLKVPYVLSGYNIRAKSLFNYARAEDVGATIFAALNLSLDPGQYAGKSISSFLVNGTNVKQNSPAIDESMLEDSNIIVDLCFPLLFYTVGFVVILILEIRRINKYFLSIPKPSLSDSEPLLSPSSQNEICFPNGSGMILDPIPLSLLNAYVMLFVFGWLGFHRFYMKRYFSGFLYLFTIGFFGFGLILDVLLLPFLMRLNNTNMHIDFLVSWIITHWNSRRRPISFKDGSSKQWNECL